MAVVDWACSNPDVPLCDRHPGRISGDSGRAPLYRICPQQKAGGIITLADLASYRARWRQPLETTYRGWQVFGMPPPSSGGVTLAEILNILEASGPLPRYGSAALMHLEIEAMRRAFTDRNTALGDPDFVAMPVAKLTSKPYAAALAHGVDDNRATPTGEVPAVDEGQHTTHYSVVDPEGNAAAVTTTLNDDFGSALVVGGAGFLLNDEMDDFTSKPGAPNLYGLVQGKANAIAPGKRMLSAMAPTIVLDPAGRLYLQVGTTVRRYERIDAPQAAALPEGILLTAPMSVPDCSV